MSRHLRSVIILAALGAGFARAGLPAEAHKPVSALMVPLWDDAPPATPAGKLPPERDVDDGHTAAIAQPRLWVMLPETPPAGPMPMVLLVPGGGYGVVSRRYEGVEIAKELNRRGIAAAVLLYRCAPQTYPAPLLDARRALALLQKNAGAWKVDAKKIGILGGSAGGHLAGLATSLVSPAGTEPKPVRPAFCVLLYPVVRLRGPLSHAGSGVNLLGKDRIAAEGDALALDALADRAWPRTYIVHDRGDPAVPSAGSVALAEKLKQLGVPYELRITEGADHGYGWNRPDSKGAIRGPADWLPVVCDWINRS